MLQKRNYIVIIWHIGIYKKSKKKFCFVNGCCTLLLKTVNKVHMHFYTMSYKSNEEYDIREVKPDAMGILQFAHELEIFLHNIIGNSVCTWTRNVPAQYYW